MSKVSQLERLGMHRAAKRVRSRINVDIAGGIGLAVFCAALLLNSWAVGL